MCDRHLALTNNQLAQPNNPPALIYPLAALPALGHCRYYQRDEAVMDIPKQQEQSAEERIGTMIGKVMVLALITFFVWAYASTLVAKLGLF